MKSVLMIGMGKYGHLLCRDMAELGNEIMIVDQKEWKTVISQCMGMTLK